MKTKKLSLAMILLAITMAACLVATLLLCYTTKPAVAEGEFPFTINYEFRGERKTLSGVFYCKFGGSSTILGEHDRYWHGETVFKTYENEENPNIIDSNAELETTLFLSENMYAGYFMGDPLYENFYRDELGLEGLEPYVMYCDYKNNVMLNEENEEEVLDSIGFKIIDYTYAAPIKNSFSYSGVSCEGDNILIFITITLVFFILCLIFVRKEKDYRYSMLDKIGIVCNVIVAIVAVPVIYVICMLFFLAETGVPIIDQTIYALPPFTILCLALSVVFRRKGFPKTGFLIQFGGVLPFALVFILELIFRLH